ncbi:MAG: benzoate-CoA ligase family protein [Gemmatimonadota bacterium]
MPVVSRADHSMSPPHIDIPREYNAAEDLIERNLVAGRADKVAFIDDKGRYTYGELARRVSRFANLLALLDVRQEERVFLCLLDTIDFPTCFLGAIKAGVVPVAANTLLTARDYDYMLRDSRARLLMVSAALWPTLAPIVAGIPTLKRIVISDGEVEGHSSLAQLMEKASTEHRTVATTCDDPCFWLYSSGSTGAPKGTVHIQSSPIYTAELFARPILGLTDNDTVFSAAKLFFAYGLGNGLTFPMSVGATTVLMAERPTPAAVFKRIVDHKVTVFYGVPTLFAALLAAPDAPARSVLHMRRCTSAGEALPQEIGKRWSEKFGVDILDGIGSTEMLHVFLTNRPGDVRYGTTGKPIPGYELRIVDDEGRPVARGELGELQIKGPTAAAMYWNNRGKTRTTFVGEWTRSGDKYRVDEDGYYVYSGRSDDMLKVSGIYVSPIEVESALISHPAVLEAAVIGREDDDKLTKPAAYVVLKPGHARSDALAEELAQFVKSQLAPYKYPRWVSFVDELPKTATGKIQRFKLRAQAASG